MKKTFPSSHYISHSFITINWSLYVSLCIRGIQGDHVAVHKTEQQSSRKKGESTLLLTILREKVLDDYYINLLFVEELGSNKFFLVSSSISCRVVSCAFINSLALNS